MHAEARETSLRREDRKHAGRGTAEPDTHGMWKGSESEHSPLPLPSSRGTSESGSEFSGWKDRGLWALGSDSSPAPEVY